MDERKLVSIQRIDNLEPIPNADKVEVASILGWKVVVQKGVHKIGELIIYFEIDAFLPIQPQYEFLRKNCYRKFEDGKEGFRIKTIRLRGQVSQGLVMPIDQCVILPSRDIQVGDDYTKDLGVVKYEPPMPVCLMGIAKGRFPSFLVKSDETRVQLLQEVLNRHIGLKCYISEKIDGSSVTYYVKDGKFGVCSRNLDLFESESNAYWKWARENDIENKLKSKEINIAIQGEIYGKEINDNPLKIKDIDVRFFNAFNIDKCLYYNFEDFKYIIKTLGLKTVPILDKNFSLINDINSLVKIAVGKSVITPNVWREGIVIRPLKEIMDLGMSVSGIGNTGRLSFKVLNTTYLLENDS